MKMCYSGRCKYETTWGDCGREQFSLEDHFDPEVGCMWPRERKKIDMKLLNKNHKLKHSKMFIDYDTYKKICEKHGSSIDEHLARIEAGSKSDDYVPAMNDVSIMFDVYLCITKIIRKR